MPFPRPPSLVLFLVLVLFFFRLSATPAFAQTPTPLTRVAATSLRMPAEGTTLAYQSLRKFMHVVASTDVFPMSATPE